jgi:RHS repeat-associated protein
VCSFGKLGYARGYTYGLDRISQKQADDTVHYFGYDGLGSVRYLTGAAGTVTDRYHYDAYGNQTAEARTTPNHYRYTGEYWDADLGMYYLRARYYEPGIGRFWSMDSYEGSQSDQAGGRSRHFASNGSPRWVKKYLLILGALLSCFVRRQSWRRSRSMGYEVLKHCRSS